MFLLPFLHHRRRLDTSPAEPHELRQLELPWAWEPTASSRAFRIGESKEPDPGFSNGNEEKEFLFGKTEM